MLKRVLAVAIAGAVLTVPALATAAPPVPPGLGLRLADAPKDRAKDPRARSYIVDHVAPGAHIVRHVEVTNGTAATFPVRMYMTAGRIAGGAFTAATGATANTLTPWVTLSPQALNVPPAARRTVTLDIRVPANAPRGEQYAAVMAEVAPDTRKPGNVRIASRVGVRVYLSVGTGSEPPSDFAIQSLTAARADDGAPQVLASVRNTGQRALDMRGSLKLTNGPGGLQAGPFPARLGTTLGLGQTESVTVVLDKALPAGPWDAKLDLQSGLLKRAATARITFPEKGAAAPVSAKLVQDDKSPPWVLVGAGVLGGLLLLGAFAVLKKRSKPRDTRDDVVVQAPR